MSEDQNKRPIVIKRIKKVSHGHHGGAWKIAYADFVTAMMAFFLLMWLLNSLEKSTLQGISAYFKSPINMSAKGGEGMGEKAQNVATGGGDQTSMKPGVVKVTQDLVNAKQPGTKELSPDEAKKIANQEDNKAMELLKTSLEKTI